MLTKELMREDEKVAPDGVVAQEIRYVMSGRLVVAYQSLMETRFFGIGHYAVIVNEAESRCEATPLGLDADVDAKMSERVRTQRAKLISNQNFPIPAQNISEAFTRYESAFREYRNRIGEVETVTARMIGERMLAAKMSDAKGGKLVVQ